MSGPANEQGPQWPGPGRAADVPVGWAPPGGAPSDAGPPPRQPYGMPQPPYAPGPGHPPPPAQGYPPPPGPGGHPPPPGWAVQPYGFGTGPYGAAYAPSPRRANRGLVVALSGFGVLVAVVVLGVVLVLTTGGDNGSGPVVATSGGAAASPAPLTRQPDGSVVMAQPGVTRPVLELYEDFQCPVCKEFERLAGGTIAQLAAQGKVRVVYRPFRLFEQEPLRSNSGRAANAAACAPAAAWYNLHALLFQNQPPEGSPGFSDAQLVGLGGRAGITGSAYAACVEGGQKAAQVEQDTSAALAAGVQGTPTLRLDGRTLDSGMAFDPPGLRSAILGGQPVGA